MTQSLTTADEVPSPPSDLKQRGRDYWTEIVAGFEFNRSEIELLAEACRCMDNLDSLNAAIEEHGTMVTGSAGQLTANPAIGEARQQRIVLHRLLSALNMGDDEDDHVTTARQTSAQQAANARWNRRSRKVR